MSPPLRSPPLRVLFAASEITPWSKTGGLGDVVSALPVALRRLNLDVRVIVPGYQLLLDAFPQRTPLAAIHHPAGAFPASTLFEAETEAGVPLLIIDCPSLYVRAGGPYQDTAGEDWPDNALRFGLLSKVAALLASTSSPLSWRPHILHCHDWQTALASAYLEYRLSPHAATVMTVHNLLFQGVFSAGSLVDLDLPAEALNIDRLEFHGNLSFLKAGLVLADAVTTVSPSYAREIMTPAFGHGLDGVLRQRASEIAGILNGIDEEVWNPAADRHIPCPYDVARLQQKACNKLALQQRLGLRPDATAPLLAVVSRLTHQKGLDLLIEIGGELAARGAQLALLGSGERGIQDAFVALGERHPKQFAIVVGYDEALAHQIEAGGDIFLMPSRFEPCGLNEMYSLHYGTPPVVRATGGLADTVIDTDAQTIAAGTANGFVFHDVSAAAFLAAIDRAIAAWRDKALWRRIQSTGMTLDFSWAHAAAQYRAVYERLRSA